MRYPFLVVFPLLWVVAFLVGESVAFGTPGYLTFLRIEVEAVKVLALVGAWVAALKFERGEYLRRGWFLVGGVMALLLVRDLTVIIPGLFEGLGERGIGLLRGALVILANISGVLGTWLLARAWKVASLSLPGSRAAQWGVVAIAAAFSFAIAGPVAVQNVRLVAAGEIGQIAGAASAIGDTINLILIAPILLTALALRGGLIGWPWALLATSCVAWLLYDGAVLIGPRLGLDERWVRVTGELFRALACTFGFTAGLAQRMVVERLRRLRPGAGPTA
jgi:hypothetical protein